MQDKLPIRLWLRLWKRWVIKYYFCFYYNRLKSIVFIHNQFLLKKCAINIQYSKMCIFNKRFNMRTYVYLFLCSLWCKLRNLRIKSWMLWKIFMDWWERIVFRKVICRNLKDAQRSKMSNHYFMRRSINHFMTISIYKVAIIKEFSIV